ncbi:MAG: YHS domain-containing protein [Chloroflexota bacterium]
MSDTQPTDAIASIAIDPVCGMEVETAGARHVTEHAGTRYRFCARGCLLDFAEDPEKFLDPDYVPSM